LSLFALFFALPSFVFNSLQTLFAKYRGVGYPSAAFYPPDLQTFRPAQADMAARKSVEARFGKQALQKQSQRQDAAFGLGALKATPLHFRGTARNRCATLAGEKN
jgi:hypothetical protein